MSEESGVPGATRRRRTRRIALNWLLRSVEDRSEGEPCARGCPVRRGPVGLAHERDRRGTDVPDRRPRPRPALVGGGELPHHRPDLPPRQRAPARPAGARPREAAAAGALGHEPGPVDGLHPAQPGDPRARGRLALRDRPRARRPRARRRRLARGHVQRGLPARHRRRRRHPHPLPPVLVARWGAQPRQRADAGECPRGWRAGLRPRPRGRRGVRPSRPRRRVRRR